MYYILGDTYYMSGRYQDAIEPFKQAIRINPDDAEAHCNLGRTYCNLDRYQEAIDACKQAILGSGRMMPGHKDAA